MQKLPQEFETLTGLSIAPQKLAALTIYADILAQWNERYSLTAIHDAEMVRVKHFLDSLSAFLALRNTPVERVVDVGTGAGFPGLPLKILCPQIQLTLIESVEKKALFCEHIVERLELDGVNIVRERAEIIGNDIHFREQFDWAVARAVALMPILMEYLLPLVRVGGHVLAMKGETGPAEAHAAEKALGILGGRLKRLLPVTLPGVVEQRYLVIIEKVAATPEKNPRRVGIPAKRPL